MLFKRKAGDFCKFVSDIQYTEQNDVPKSKFLAVTQFQFYFSGIRGPGFDIYYCYLLTGDNFNIYF